MNRRAAFVVAIAGVLAYACHDAPSAWEPSDQDGLPSGARQLTFSAGDDRSPAWSSDGQAILYVADGLGDLARSDGVLVSIPRAGGPVATVFPLLQPERVAAPALHVPAVDSVHDRVAYVQLLSAGGSVCSGDSTSCDMVDELDDPPSLTTGRIRARTIGAATPAERDPTLTIAFDGVEFDDSRHPFNLPGVWITRLHPFQRRFNEEGALPSRAAWDPSGRRLVTSDGLRLLTWTPGDTLATPIPGTDEGSSPAWSPDGDWIAFSRLERGAVLDMTCEHLVVGAGGTFVGCVEERAQWPIARSLVVLVAPDGGTPIELAEGLDPAWSPDGEWVFFSRTDGIWRVRATGSDPVRIPETEGGTQPAVSPDGSELAFTRSDAAGKGDIWVVPLTP